MKSGWIKLHRSFRGHWLWKTKEPFTKREAWIDLLMCANFTDNKIPLGGGVVEIRRGQQARSELTLADEWKWSRGKVRRFLKCLEDDSMIVQHKTHLTSVITICNYERFQGDDTADSTTSGTTDGTTVSTTNGQPTVQQAVHSKEGKENKKENKSRRFVPPTLLEAQDYFKDKGCSDYIFEAEKFIDFYESKGWMVGKNKMKDWKAAIRNWLKKSPARVEKHDLSNKDYGTMRML